METLGKFCSPQKHFWSLSVAKLKTLACLLSEVGVQRQVMLIFKFIILFWITTRVHLHALTPKKHTILLPLSSETLGLSSCLFKATPPENYDWLAHTRLR